MAGDWIKFEHSTSDKPEVIKMAALLRIEQDAIVGKLLRVWVWADLNSVSGEQVGITAGFIDRLTCKRGFAEAMRSAGWLQGEDGNILFTNFSRNNGATAKARAMENRKKSSQRERGKCPPFCPDAIGTKAGHSSGQKGGPEKRREDIEEEEEEGGSLALVSEVAGHTDPNWSKESGWRSVSDEHKGRWLSAYPACDVGRQLAQMDLWLRANPAESRKSNWLRFITNWLKREQDRGGDSRADRKTLKGGNNANYQRSNDRSTEHTDKYAEQLRAAGL